MSNPKLFGATVPVRGLFQQGDGITFRSGHTEAKPGHNRAIALRPEDAANIKERLESIGATPPGTQPA